MRCDALVKRNVYMLIALIGVLLGAIGALTMVRFSAAAILGILVLAFFLLDYSRVTYVVALFIVIDYALRQVIKIPLLASSWDELLFVSAIFLWMLKWFIDRRQTPYRITPLEIPLLFFIGVSTFLMLVNSPDLPIGIEGLRAVVQYMLFYFVGIQLLKNREQVRYLLYVLLFAGCLIGLHGIYQYITRAPMPEGWMDRMEAGVRARAFSIAGSPNILGSLMVLLIPVSISLVFVEKQLMKRLAFGGIALVMTGCLLFTLSRSALISFMVAITLYALMKDRRLILPMILGAVLIAVLLPSVVDRFIYMLSPVYLESSLKGGRAIRWLTGWQMFTDNLWLGVGLGRFGGAVAMNHKDLFPDTYYMDNYMLKTAVEMGLIGITTFLLLLYNTILWSFRAIRTTLENYYKNIAQGILAGMVGVIVHNFTENIFEVPMMVTYFWLFAGIIMYLGYTSGKEEVPVAVK
jgi:O-antigen ligase